MVGVGGFLGFGENTNIFVCIQLASNNRNNSTGTHCVVISQPAPKPRVTHSLYIFANSTQYLRGMHQYAQKGKCTTRIIWEDAALSENLNRALGKSIFYL